MERIPMDSSNIISAGYDPESKTLEVEFKGKIVWQYYDFPENMWNEFLGSRSKGKYFASQVAKQWAGRSNRVQ